MWTDELCFNVVFVMWTMVVGSEDQYIIEDEFTHKNHVQAFWGWIRPQNLRTDWLLQFNLVKVEIHELRPEVVAESDEVLVHYRSRTNMRQGLSTKALA